MESLQILANPLTELGWTDKVLEIFSTNFRVEPGEGDGAAPSVRVDFGVQETAASATTWTLRPRS